MAQRGIHTYTVQEALNIELGQGGTEYIATGGSSSAGSYIVKIQSTHDNTTITATGVDAKFSDLTAVALPKGATIVGAYSSVTVGGTSGGAIVYKG
tara:strand:+ start:254 stop:541 length:288 start_codon:yes stop_codon:yes gene_type:complete